MEGGANMSGIDLTKYPWYDWCPLCGCRFLSDNPDTLGELILEHTEDGTCESNFVPPEIALKDGDFFARLDDALRFDKVITRTRSGQ